MRWILSTPGLWLWEKGPGVLQADKHGPCPLQDGPGALTVAEGVSFCVRDKLLAEADLHFMWVNS